LVAWLVAWLVDWLVGWLLVYYVGYLVQHNWTRQNPGRLTSTGVQIVAPTSPKSLL
jgi:Na+/melibiose symporter-like transporter